MTKRKKNPWFKKADKKWGELIRAPGKCAVCGNFGRVEAHHLIHRQVHFFRHNLENGIALCAQCHKFNTTCSAHASPWAFNTWMHENRPDQYQWWNKNRWVVVKGVKLDYEAIYKELCAVDSLHSSIHNASNSLHSAGD